MTERRTIVTSRFQYERRRFTDRFVINMATSDDDIRYCVSNANADVPINISYAHRMIRSLGNNIYWEQPIARNADG